MMQSKDKLMLIKEKLDILFPSTSCFLNHSNDFELLVAVVLSAQAKDEVVNKVTKDLFSRYKTVEELAEADYNEVYNLIKLVGLGNTKAKNIIELAKIIHTKYLDNVPSSREELTALPGVGNKTASVVRGELFSLPQIPVDTHVNRVMLRLGIAKKSDTPTSLESKLLKLYKGKDHINFHRQVILFGRNYCKAKSPLCESCPLVDLCTKKLK